MAVDPESLIWSGPEPNRNPGEAAWYGVTDMSFVFAVAGTSPEQALLALEEYNTEELGLQGLMVPTIHEHSPEVQSELRQRYGERLTVMVIPFSVVEYPVDDGELTAEQQAAFDRLK